MHAALMLVSLLGAEPTATWTAFRGAGDSVTTARDLPLHWSEEQNLAWRVGLTGYGQSSPVVWDQNVFVATVDGEMKDRLFVTSLNLSDGAQRWQKEFPGTQKVKTSDYVSKSAPTPCVDAERVYAFFESGDLVALDHAGETAWTRSLTKDYGEFQGNHGIGCSPALAPGAVVVLIEHDGPSYLIALDRATGENLWKTDLEPRTAWSSPVVSTFDEQPAIIISASGVVAAYAAKDGAPLWKFEDVKANTVPSPTVASDLVLIGSKDKGSNLLIRTKRNADGIQPELVWKADEATSSFASPLAHQGFAYFVNTTGSVFSFELESGKSAARTRLPGSCWASPLGAGDRVYFFGKDGATVVTSADGKLEKLAENSLKFDSPVHGVAAVDGAFVVRSGTECVCIRATKN